MPKVRGLPYHFVRNGKQLYRSHAIVQSYANISPDTLAFRVTRLRKYGYLPPVKYSPSARLATCARRDM